VAALFGGLQVLVMIGVGYVWLFQTAPIELTDPYRDGVYYFSIFGNDPKVFCLGRRGYWDVEAYVLDSNGRLAQHLFHVDQAEHLRPEPWLEDTKSPLVLCYQADVSFRRTGPSRSWSFLLNLDTGAKTPFKHKEGDRNTTYNYLRPSADGHSVLGYKQVYQDRRYRYSVLRHEMVSSDIREIPIFEDEGSATCHFLDDRRVLVANFWPAKNQLIMVDVESGIRTIRQIPADIHETYLAPDGRSCAALRWIIEGDTIRQELALLDIATGGWKTVLTADGLPRLAVKDALANRQCFPSISYPDGHVPQWMVCSIDRRSAATTKWLINSQTGARLQLPEKDKGEISRFSKDGSRFFTGFRMENKQEPEDSRPLLLTFYQIKEAGIELVNSFTWDDAHDQLKWIGNDRLLYLKRGNRDNGQTPHRRRLDLGLLYERGELWTVDVATGQQRPFFTGASAAEH
jgi:hypothetical protein